MAIKNFMSDVSKNGGMTYVELIVVLSIFSIMSSIVMFNYDKFQQAVNIKVLASDIALKIVEAQKSSMGGKWNALAGPDWKPSYGLYFNTASNQNFIYFADLDNNGLFENLGCTGECQSQIGITKGNYISSINLFGTGCPSAVDNLDIVYKRPEPTAIISSSPVVSCNLVYAEILVSSPNLITAKIDVYPSGRIQIN